MFDTSGRVAHVRRVKVAPHFLRPMLGAPEESPDVAHQPPRLHCRWGLFCALDRIAT